MGVQGVTQRRVAASNLEKLEKEFYRMKVSALNQAFNPLRLVPPCAFVRLLMLIHYHACS